jgi:hypothetical protein
VRSHGAGGAPLVEVVDRRGRTGGVVRCGQRRTACPEPHRLRGTAPIRQGTRHGVAVDAGTGRIGIAQVPATVGDFAGAVPAVQGVSQAVGDDRVLQRQRAGVEDAAAVTECRAIAGEGAVADGRYAAVADAADIPAAITDEGAIADDQCAAVVDAP